MERTTAKIYINGMLTGVIDEPEKELASTLGRFQRMYPVDTVVFKVQGKTYNPTSVVRRAR